jgi:multiple sugar transport system permease protein
MYEVQKMSRATTFALGKLAMDQAASVGRRSADRFSLVAVCPAVIILVVFLFLFFYGVYQSLTNLRFGAPTMHFVGLRNYAQLIQSADFWINLRVTLTYAMSCVALEAGIGLAIARLFASDVFLARMLRPMVLLPLVLPPMSVALMWTTMMNPQAGILNYLLSLVGLGPFTWISNEHSALASVILIDVWTFTPFFTLIIFAGLQGITDDIREAARINGAKAWSIFYWIELPLVAPYILVAALFRLIESLTQFDIIFGTTQGGPGDSTATLSVQAYITAFQDMNFGRGAALMVVNWLVVLGSAMLLAKLWQAVRRRVS